jgi:cytochrome c oxidase subunit 3
MSGMSSEAAARPDAHVEFQYHDATHQSETAISGMWLFLATEILFFGGLFLAWFFYRFQHPAGFAEATRHTQLVIGTVNTVLLVTSSFVYCCGLTWIELGNRTRLLQCALVTLALGLCFLGLKILEWYKDIDEGLVPGVGFALREHGGAQLFYVFYYIGTGLHAAHMSVGIVLVSWIAWRARRGDFSQSFFTPVEVVGLYWSFVDMLWLILYPLIYLAGRAG